VHLAAVAAANEAATATGQQAGIKCIGYSSKCNLVATLNRRGPAVA